LVVILYPLTQIPRKQSDDWLKDRLYNEKNSEKILQRQKSTAKARLLQKETVIST